MPSAPAHRNPTSKKCYKKVLHNPTSKTCHACLQPIPNAAAKVLKALSINLDVVALYPSITHRLSAKALREVLTLYKEAAFAKPGIDCIIDLAMFVLKNTHANFNGDEYVPTAGYGMGIDFACQGADMAMIYFDRLMHDTKQRVHIEYQSRSVVERALIKPRMLSDLSAAARRIYCRARDIRIAIKRRNDCAKIRGDETAARYLPSREFTLGDFMDSPERYPDYRLYYTCDPRVTLLG